MRTAPAWLAMLVAAPALASHPLISEDTGVLERGEWEFELHGERARDSDLRRSDVAVKLGYGFTDKATLEVELPYVREEVDGETVKGRGDASLAVKWRFYEKDGMSLAFKPDLLLPTGRDEEGLGAGKLRWAANLAAGYETGEFEFRLHVGYTDNRNTLGERRSLWHASAAMLYEIAKGLKLAADYGRDSQPDPTAGTHGRELVLGAIYELTPSVELGLGVKKALNDSADDRSLRAGIKLRW